MPGIRLSTLVRRLRRETAPGEGCSDVDLLARFGRARDDAAFELLVWRHGAMVLGTCQRTLGNTEDAEDAFQATFLVLARKAAGIRSGITLPAWLHRVAVRIASRLVRGRRPVASLESEPPDQVAPDPAERTEGLAVLDEEINRLPERSRRAVVLCYLEGLTASDAARLLGCPTGTVESRLAAARKTLRDRLTRRGVTLPAGVLAVLAGQATLAPEAVARVVRAGVAFLRDGAAIATGIVGEPSVKLAQGVLTMWSVRARAGLLAVAVAVAATAGVVWADREQSVVVADEPATKPVVAIAPPPVAKGETPADPPEAKVEAWPVAKQFGMNGELKGFTPDGRSLIIHYGSQVSLFDLTKDTQSYVVNSSNTVTDIAISPDGKFIATAEGTNGVKLRDAATGNILDALWPSGGISPRQVVFTADGKKLIALCLRPDYPDWPQGPNGGFGGRGLKGPNPKKEVVRKSPLTYQVSVWDLATRKEVGRPVEPISSSTLTRSPPRIEFAAGGRFLLKTEELVKEVNGTEIDSFRVSIIDPLTGTVGKPAEFRVPEFTPASPADLTLSPDGKAMIAVNSASREVLVFDTSTGQERLRLGRLPREVRAVAFSPDGKRVAAATGFDPRPRFAGPGRVGNPAEEDLTGPTEVVIWDATTGKELARLGDKETNRDYQSIRFGTDGLYLIAHDSSGRQSSNTTIWGRPPQPEPVKPTPIAKNLPQPEAPVGVPDHFQALIRDLSADGVPDSRRVNAVFLAALGRFPTEVEANTLAAQIARQTDKSAALRDLLATLVDTTEFQAHAAALQQLTKPTPPSSVSPENPSPPFNPGRGGKGPGGKNRGKG
jgi:RNA polymerase sigma factor (sigma-70 family)